MFLCWNATVCLDCSLSFSSNPQLTILVAADGALKFPDVRNYGDLKAVVERLNSIPTRQIQVLIDHCNDFFQTFKVFTIYVLQFICIFYSWLGLLFQGIQVLWTPQDEKDILSEEKLLEDYPYLKPLCDD
jgi:hypothetical protein